MAGMDDFAGLFFDGDEPSAQEKALALAAALRQQRAGGQLGMLTGDRVLGQFGQAQMQGADRQEGLLANQGQFRSGQRLTRAMAAEQLTERAKDRQLQRDFQAGQNALTRAMARQGREDRHQDKVDATAAKLDAEDAERRIDGLEFIPGIRPSPDAAKKGKDGKTAIDAMLPDIDSMIAALDENDPRASGTEMFSSEAGSRLQRARQAVSDRLRVFSEMGVPNARDYQSLENYLPELTGLGASLSRNAPMQAKLKDLKAQLLRQWESTHRNLGYQRPGGQAAPDAPTAAPGAADVVMVIPPGGTQPVPVHKAKVSAAVAAGGRVVSGG